MTGAVMTEVVSDRTDEPDPQATARFLSLMSEGEPVTFQTFDDQRSKTAGLAQIRHGTLEQHLDALVKLNQRGAGVFWMVNYGDGQGRTAGNVTGVRALFVDLDGAPIGPVHDCPLQPHAVIESSPGRFHAYWLITGCDLADFGLWQKALARRFSGDPSVHDLPRVMRLPGFVHRKNEPFVSRIVDLAQLQPYELDELVGKLQLSAHVETNENHCSQPHRAEGTDLVIEGSRNAALTQLAGKLRRDGLSSAAIEGALLETNRERCRPPLDDHEVQRIARSIGRYPAGSQAAGPANASAAAQDGPTGDQRKDDDRSPLTPPTMAPEGFPPLVQEIVSAACSSSEAHPVAVAANLIARFSCAVGRNAYQRIGDTKIHCRPFFLIGGKSSKARKGTSEITVREINKRADAKLRDRLQTLDVFREHVGGMSTAEGLAYVIRDGQEADDNGKGGDEGVKDKRLFVSESEFANVLGQIKREGNTLSPALRTLFDGQTLEPLTKTSRTKASHPHVVNVAYITGFELREKSTENDAANGLLNRYVCLHVYRPKLVPLPEPTPDNVLDDLAEKLADAIQYASKGKVHARDEHEVTMSPEACQYWCERYEQITRDRDGKAGSLLARSEMYARMLAMIFALMDKRSVIEPCDLRAALAWLDYWHHSVTYIYLCGDDDAELNEFDKELLAVVTKQPGISLSQIQEHWHRKKTTAVKGSLERLLNMAPPLIECKKDDTTGGRAASRYYAYAREVI
jgi:hypothetical protein